MFNHGKGVFTRQTLALVAGCIGFLAVLCLPAPEGMGPLAQKTAAVTVLMACWWLGEATHLAVTSLLPIVLFPLLGVASSRSVSINYANHLIFLYIGGFLIASAMERCNLHRRIALRMINRFGAKPERLVLGFMVTTALLSMWISNTATTMMMLPMAMAVVQQLSGMGESKDKPAATVSARTAKDVFGCILLLGIAYSASIGGIATIVGSPTTVAFLGFISQTYPDYPPIGFVQWSLLCVPVVIVFIPVTWLYLCRFGGPIPLSSIEFPGSQNVIRDEIAALGSMNKTEKRVLTVAASTGLLWVSRVPLELGRLVLPGWSQWLPEPSMVHDSTVAMVMGLLLFLIPSEGLQEGGGSNRILEWTSAVKSIPWGIIFLLGGGFALAAGIQDSGLAVWIGTRLSAMEGLPVWLIVLAICVLATTLTEMTSNVATVLMLAPAVAAMAVEVNVHPYLLLIPMAVLVSFAFTMPVSTPPNAIVISSGWISIPQMFKAGIVLDILGLLVVPPAIYLIAIKLFDLV